MDDYREDICEARHDQASNRVQGQILEGGDDYATLS